MKTTRSLQNTHTQSSRSGRFNRGAVCRFRNCTQYLFGSIYFEVVGFRRVISQIFEFCGGSRTGLLSLSRCFLTIALLLGAFNAYAQDWGDAPANYGVLTADNGPYHAINPSLYIGNSSPDFEIDGQPSALANADDTTGTDDEDGIGFSYALMTISTSYRIPAGNILVTNGLASDVILHAWIDFDNDGIFEASEYQSTSIPAGTTNGNPSTDLFWDGLSNLPGGVAFVRFRLAEAVLTDNVATSIDERALGDGGSGEVEDYAISYYRQPPTVFPTDVPVCSIGGTPQIAIAKVWDSAGNNADISYATPYAGDFNGDGNTDLIIASTSGFVVGNTNGRDGRRFNVYLGPIVPGTTNQAPSIVLNTVWYEWSTTQPWSVADVNGDGQAELVIIASNYNGGTQNNGYLYAYNIITGAQVWRSNAPAGYLTAHDGAPPGFADFNNDSIPELYVYNKIFNARTGVLLASGGSSNNIGNPDGNNTDVFGTTSTVSAVDIDGDGDLELAAGGQVYDVVITNTNGTAGNSMPLLIDHPVVGDGYTMVVDMDLDGDPDIIVLNQPELYIYDGQSTALMGEINILSSDKSGIPFVGNLDTDPQPEIAVVTSNRVRSYDYDPSDPVPTSALSVAWTFNTSDGSGQTGITLFDFNQDSVQELVYRDQTQLRIIDSQTQANISTFSCKSGTGTEHPIIADIDNDGGAELVTVCGTGVDGELQIFEEAPGTQEWVATRSVWNQFSYFSIHINDDLTIPQNQPWHWLNIGSDQSGCTTSVDYPYNSFRAQVPMVDINGCQVQVAPFDWGDAPGTYKTTEAETGAAHHFCDTLYLGAAISGESDGFPTAGADGDTNDDGVIFQSHGSGNGSTLRLYAHVTGTNATGETAMLCGWLDGASDGSVSGGFDRNVTYTTVGVGTATAIAGNEEICVQVAAAGGAGSSITYPPASGFNGARASCNATAGNGTFSCTLTFNPNFQATTTTYARFRLTTDPKFFSVSSPSPVGTSGLGELEDYRIDISPTAVTIGKVGLQALTVSEFLTGLGVNRMDTAALLELLGVWDPESAIRLADADRETLLAALQNYLDPDGDGHVAVLQWETVEERGTIGFYVERTDSQGTWHQINNEMLPGLITAPLGGSYWLADPEAQPGVDYLYRMIEQEARGTQNTYGPYPLNLN